MDNKFKVFVILALVVLGIVAGASTFMAITVMNQTAAQQTAYTSESERDNKDLILVNLSEPITCNIVDEVGKPHVMRIVIALEVDRKNGGYKKFNKSFGEKEIIVRDAVIALVRQQTYEMMSRADAQEKLADEIVTKVNELLSTTVVQNVYFGDFFVQ